MSSETFLEYFTLALQKANRAPLKEEIPIGAAIVRNGEILAVTSNETEKLGSFLGHAEMIALKKASKQIRSKYLTDCDLYITLEPCRMCLAAAQLCRVRNIFYLLPSEKFGAKGKGYFKTKVKNLGRNRKYTGLKMMSLEMLKNFFEKKRKK